MNHSVGEGHGRLGWIRESVTKEKDCCGAATGLRFGQVRCVAMDVEYHVGWEIADGGRWMG